MAKTKGKIKKKPKSPKKVKTTKKVKATKKVKTKKKIKIIKKSKIQKKVKTSTKPMVSKKIKIKTTPGKIIEPTIIHGTLSKEFDSSVTPEPKVESVTPEPKVESVTPEPKVESVTPEPETVSTIDVAVKAEDAVKKALQAEAASKIAREVEHLAKKQAMDAAEKEYEAISKDVQAAIAEAVAASTSFTNQYRESRIFRREMGEPEFWLDKNGLTPPRPILTPEEEQEISKNALIPKDNTPAYVPDHVLSPEFSGTSNYESGVSEILKETKLKLERLKADPNSSRQEIEQTELDLKKLDYLHENYYLGMNVFRTARGGRDKLRE